MYVCLESESEESDDRKNGKLICCMEIKQTIHSSDTPSHKSKSAQLTPVADRKQMHEQQRSSTPG